jgi:hypothetical protein
MSVSLGGVVARLGVVLVLTTIVEAGVKFRKKKQKQWISTVWPVYMLIFRR